MWVQIKYNSEMDFCCNCIHVVTTVSRPIRFDGW
jgi:hypothetical protein